MDARVEAFLQDNHAAVMTTLRKDGTPHVARVLVGPMRGKVWSSGTRDRVRTGNLRRDPRSTLCVFSYENRYAWLGLECRVAILDGDDAPRLNLELYRSVAGEPDDVDEYLDAMTRERRLIYEFEVIRAYGDY